MPKKKCNGCQSLRELVIPKWPSCKDSALCELIDTSLLCRFHARGVREGKDYYQELGVKFEEGINSAQSWLDSHGVTKDANDFVRALRVTHKLAFEQADPEIAGRFRNANEKGYFGGEGQHQLTGAPASKIVNRLEELYEIVENGFEANDRTEFARIWARFLEKFFRIHPFTDGNGRIGRVFLRHATHKKPFLFKLEAAVMTGKDRHKYRKALEYAHKHALESEHPDKRRVPNPYRYLERWIENHLEERPPESEQVEAEEPEKRE